ncbi:MAG: PIG-L family deacetylase [Dehalococcoidia bacterium]|uniref:PIG-L deacetylase family protein n=1 Tax=Candidatus Amarobacter glycogenicus TaxID=3140699 RepID=UPI00313551CB|nr:PIG-L family deacetylase [Dehalococcoidia bacterium]MBK6563380.1 PIG-L family deacetylase [Dehalococcoidia bacterium]MBK7126060.1 PIG-L family deacetylase [Dehalococcoidia bacterium]MBK9342067.1 PIG-L family deacetylase [Dehalococcoidia bacterium]MBK9544706.1 PIG-L family deacetylase [Dehalococcoidia bacterium]
MSKKAKEKKKQRLAESAAPAAAAPLIGSAQQAAPPPIEGPARAMVIVAHPDDAEFMCGGTVAKWCKEGWDVYYVLVTGGDKGTHDDTMHPEKLAAIREEEQRAACRLLGVKECILLGYPDGFTSESAELRGQIVRLLRLYRPDVVITWDAFRGTFNHRDHRNVGQATMDAIYPIVRDRLFYQRDEEDGLASHQVNEVLLAGAADGDYVVDVTDVWEKKVDAILCHTSQIGGRTKEAFLKERAEREAKEPGKPVEERFRRWSIRRPPRQTKPEDEQKEEASVGAKAKPQHVA